MATTISILTVRTDRYHGGKFFAVVALAVVAAFAGYNGWISLPSLTALGGVMGLAVFLLAVAAIFIAVNVDNRWARNAALIIAVTIAVIITLNWDKVQAAFATFTWASLLGLALAIAVTFGIAAWASRKPAVAESD